MNLATWGSLILALLVPALAVAHPLDALAPGQWYQAPNTKLRPVCPVPPPVGSCAAIMNAWSGGAYDSKRDRLVIWGGGHGDYWGNELDVFDVTSLSWSRAWGPSPNATIQANGTDLAIDEVNGDGALVGESLTPGFIDTGLSPSTRYTYQVVAVDTFGRRSRISKSITIKTPALAGATVNSTGPLSVATVTSNPTMVMHLTGATNSPTSVTLVWDPSSGTDPIAKYQVYRDANPVSRHTYGGLQYLPALDRFWASGGSLQGGSGGGGQASWLFDFDALKWKRIGEKPGSDFPASAVDPASGDIYAMLGSTLYQYSFATDTWTNRQIEGSSAFILAGQAALDPERRVFLHVGDGLAYRVRMVGPPPWPRENVTPGQPAGLTGDTEIITTQVAPGLYNRPGIAYDPIGRQFVLWVGGADVYTINPDTLVTTRVAPTAGNTVTPTAGPTAGTYGRWRYMPKWDAFVGVNSIDGDVYFYKPMRGASVPVCGNGVLEPGEACDLGTGNGACPAACSATCTLNTCQVCGNGVVEAGEQCDLGPGNGACPSACSATCTVNACPPPTFPVTIEPVGGGVGCFSGAGNYAAGTLVTLGAQASAGTLTWGGDPLCTTGQFTMPARAVPCQVSTTLAPPSCTVPPQAFSMDVTTTGPGTAVTAKPQYMTGEDVAIVATPASGAMVTGVGGDQVCAMRFKMPAKATKCAVAFAASTCGNGIVEVGEQCDLGSAANGPCPAACSATCQVNNCSGSIDIPSRQWVGLTMPANPPAGLPGVIKHTMPSYSPLNGRIYFTGGDFGSTPGTSYRQDSYSLSLAARWLDRGNPNAGWRQEYPFCGPAGGVQPKHPDYVGFPWDSKRQVFWMVPGLMEAWGGGECPGESGGQVSDPGYNHDKVMTFDPAPQRWAVQAADYFGKAGNADADMGWGVVYDAQTDSLVRLTGDLVDTLALATQTWTRAQVGLAGKPPGINQSGATLRLGGGYAALDPVARVVYSIDANEGGNWGALYRHTLGTNLVEYLGPLPMNYGLSAAYETQYKIVWNPKNRLLYWNSHMPNGFFAYHPDTKVWEALGTATNIPGVQAVNSNLMVYDPGQDVLLMFGDVWGEPGSPQNDAKPWMFLFRY